MELQQIGEMRSEDGERLLIMETRFIESGGMCFLLLTEYGEPYMKLGVALTPEEVKEGVSSLGPGEFFVRCQSWDEEALKLLLGTGLFEDTGRRVKYGRNVPGAVWKKR